MFIEVFIKWLFWTLCWHLKDTTVAVWLNKLCTVVWRRIKNQKVDFLSFNKEKIYQVLQSLTTWGCWYGPCTVPNDWPAHNPAVRRSVSRMIAEPLTEVWAVLCITKHSMQRVGSAHLQWIRPNVFLLKHTVKKGRREKLIYNACKGAWL